MNIFEKFFKSNDPAEAEGTNQGGENRAEGAEMGWKGNWAAGERPEGYVRTTARYQKLKQRGFSTTRALGPEFVQAHNENMRRAFSGTLTGEELKELLDNNRRLNEAMDEFEKM